MKLVFEDFAPLFGEWAERFRPFIESEKMFDIYQRLKADSGRERVLPDSDVVFRSFATTSPRNLKSIWYLMDPYPRLYKNGKPQATGIPMDCTNSEDRKLQPSLEIFYDTMSKELGKKVEYTPDLTYLLNQGVMLLNSDLTVKKNKTNSHDKLWEPFQKYFLEEIMSGFTGIIYVLAGNVSHRLEKYINPLGNYIYKIEHPAAASHSHTDWKNKNIFTLTNKLLRDNNNEQILWDKKDWEQEPPF